MKDIVSAHLNDSVLRAIEVYNRYRSPEATAKLVGIQKDCFIIEFKGPFCESCGVNDYFEDFIYELENISEDFSVEVKATEPAGPQSFRVQYSVKDRFSVANIEEEALFREFLRDRGLSFSEYLASNACTKDVIMFHFRTWLFERKPETKK
ncbi:MAG TPA: hypothetical protein ENN36_02725 [Candidatus Bathyarchaeota archaeon]|nr:hypothetical protein [Candidatus Bathyarchaeota archaeon]